MSLPRLALTALPFLALAFGASPALAHAGHEHGLVAGFLHPLMGADHVAARVAIGLWACPWYGFGDVKLFHVIHH